jgi:hypothetical protein
MTALTDGECYALFCAFCHPPYHADFELIEQIWSMGQKPKVIYTVHEEYAREYFLWQDATLDEIF